MATLIIECDNSVAISFIISSISFSDLPSFSFSFLSSQLSTSPTTTRFPLDRALSDIRLSG